MGISDIGRLLVWVAFASIATSGLSAFLATRPAAKGWRRYVVGFYWLHLLAVVGVVCVLYVPILRDDFSYHYVWRHSATYLSLGYKISCLWEGQEGSFLLWIFWNALLGLLFLHNQTPWRYHLLSVMALLQVCVTSMLLGIFVGGTKIGLSPFLLTKEVLDLPIYQSNPHFVPEEGNGLNILLQNYWMIIHPPTLFLGFALSSLPFCYAIVALWKREYNAWVQPAFAWTTLATLILGVGIVMGAYWAYETLNFGGYWNWDPVENAVYIPWLLLIATIHAMLLAKKKMENGTKNALVFCIASFLAVLYATFLVRSGILGNTSVHSFTDAGLSRQILLFLLICTGVGATLLLSRWKELPSQRTKTLSLQDSNFWLFLGISTLFLMSFQVLIPTSIPVYNAIGSFLGGSPNVAPPADPVVFYTNFQQWFACAVLLLSGVAQFFWWKHLKKNPMRRLRNVGSATLLILSLVLLYENLERSSYMVLMGCGIFAVLSNGYFLWLVARRNLKACGGLIAHLGVALIVLGILYSSGFSKVISLNNTGLLWSKDFPEEINQKNILLFEGEKRTMQGFDLCYQGRRAKIQGMPGYTRLSHLRPTADTGYYLTKVALRYEDSLYYAPDERVRLEEIQKSYFALEYTRRGEMHTFYPSVSMDENIETVVYSPAIKHTITKDFYAHVRTFPDPKKITWSKREEKVVGVGEFFFVNDYVAVLEKIIPLSTLDAHAIHHYQAAVKVVIKIMGVGQDYYAAPIFVIKDDEVGYLPEVVESVAARLTLLNIRPEDDRVVIGIERTQKPWIILELMEKPLINVLWMGVGFLCLGLLLSTIERFKQPKTLTT